MSVTCQGIAFYDPRHSIKAEAAETIPLGASCRLASDGKIYVVDNSKSDVCHGFALEAAVAGQQLTLVGYCRMKVSATQTIGARVYTGAVSGGSAPSTTLSASGLIVGFAWKSDEVVVRAATAPAADG